MDEALTVPAPGGRWAPVRLLGDERLAQLASNGDRNAFAEIYRRYHQELYRYCRAILSCPEDAQDALQNTMVNILRALPGESRTIALRPWLYRVAHNEAITLVRQRTAAVAEEEVPEQLDPQAEHRTEHRERLRQVLADLNALPDRQRGALTMRELSGMSYADIGDSLGLSDAAARQAVYEARVALQELAEGREMECEAARQALSSQDKRVLRGRKLRAHLRACAGCRGFKASIDSRKVEFAALAPPLPAAAAAGLLQAALSSGGAALGGGAAGAAATGGAAAGGASAGNGLFGLLGGAAANGVAGSTAAKSVAAAVAAGAIGAGAGGAADVANVPLVGGSTATKEATPSGAPPGVHPGLEDPASGRGLGGSPAGEAAKARSQGAKGNKHGKGHGRGNGARQRGSGGPGAKPGRGNAPATVPGKSNATPQAPAAPPAHGSGSSGPPPQSGGNGGGGAHGGGPPQSVSPGPPTGHGPPAHSSGSPGGQSSPPGHASGGSADGNGSAAAAHGGTPAHGAASSGAPGHAKK